MNTTEDGQTQVEENWQASYLSPSHTKLKKEGRSLGNEKDKEKDRSPEWFLKFHFKGILPYYRVWEIKAEEMDGEIPTIGRGTPSRPNVTGFNREMSATKLFLKDYQKRRGLTNKQAPVKVSEEEMDVKLLKKNRSVATKSTDGYAPEALYKRKKSINRTPSKLVS